MLNTLLDFIFGYWVANMSGKKAKLFLWLSILTNVGTLCLFKYYNFFTTQAAELISKMGGHSNFTLLHIILPVGISFYTFHGMSYVFDVYQKKQEPVKNIADYAVFVSFFPLLVAGPIERAHHLLPQILKNRKFSYSQATEGCRLFLWGMFKKVIIADTLAKDVNAIFNDYTHHDPLTLIFGAIAFSFQIYGDFSGYTDMALGTAKLFGFELLTNFKFPYFSRDIAEFWRRWHISLSSWFRDYLYIPLGGSKQGKLKAVRNTFIIFFISGFWHGSNWTFIAWGGIHACCFLPLLILNKNRKYVSTIVAQDSMLPSLKEAVQMISTFLVVTFAWVFFRSPTITSALDYIGLLFHNNNKFAEWRLTYWIDVLFILSFILIDWWQRRDGRVLRVSKYGKYLVYIIMGVLVFLGIGRSTSFIYFQF